MLYGTIADQCVCTKMTAGAGHEYYWSDGENANTTLSCPARVYIDYLMTWVQDELDNENIFPSQIGNF